MLFCCATLALQQNASSACCQTSLQRPLLAAGSQGNGIAGVVLALVVQHKQLICYLGAVLSSGDGETPKR